MNILLGDKFIEVRHEPLSKRNRQRFDLTKKETGDDGDPREFIGKIIDERDRIFSNHTISRRGSRETSLNLEYIFWRISNSRYANEK